MLDDWENDDTSEVVKVQKTSDKKTINDEINVHDTSKEDAKMKES